MKEKYLDFLNSGIITHTLSNYTINGEELKSIFKLDENGFITLDFETDINHNIRMDEYEPDANMDRKEWTPAPKKESSKLDKIKERLKKATEK